jgi:mRNA interferase RelE/StbE
LQNPKNFGKPLPYGFKASWRYRIEDYRIICRIEEKELIILVLAIGHRKEIYKKS